MPDSPDVLPRIYAATLTPIVRHLLGPDAQLDGPWHSRSLHGGFGGQGLYRFDGRAVTRGGVRPWSMVMKVCPPGSDDRDPAAWDAPRREALAYTSGFLAQLPGPLVAPRCLALADRPDGSARRWLEDVSIESGSIWK